jgi:hypothetical protein
MATTTKADGQAMVLSTEAAQVTTASVQVQTLTIRGKQVTLAVFRQLREENIIDPETMQLRGVPWGHVSYRWGDCQCRGQDHLHVVWQKGSELRRCCVERLPEPDYAVWTSDGEPYWPAWAREVAARIKIYRYGAKVDPETRRVTHDANEQVRRRWAEQYDALARLDQLFIAV